MDRRINKATTNNWEKMNTENSSDEELHSPSAINDEEEFEWDSYGLDRWHSFETEPSLFYRRHYNTELDLRRKEIKSSERRQKINSSDTREVENSASPELDGTSDASQNEDDTDTAAVNLEVVEIVESVSGMKTPNKFVPTVSARLLKVIVGAVVSSAIIICLLLWTRHIDLKRNDTASYQVDISTELATEEVRELARNAVSSDKETTKVVPDLSFSDESLLMFEFSIFRRVS